MFKPLILALLILLTLFTFNFRPTFLESSPKPQTEIHAIKHFQVTQSLCDRTLYPALCVSTVSAVPNLRSKSMRQVIAAAIAAAMKEVRASADNCSRIRLNLMRKLNAMEMHALADCLELYSVTIAQLKKIAADLSPSNSTDAAHYDDLQTLLSGAMTNQYTCLDGFSHSGNRTRRLFEGRVSKITRQFSNALTMLQMLRTRKRKRGAGGSIDGVQEKGFPTWLKESDHVMLEDEDLNKTRVDLVVAQDGSGNYSTINAALGAAPNNSNTRFVIYIKRGSYFEYVAVDSRKMNIMFLGDGIGRTLIKGNRSVLSNWTTYRSATVAVVGNGFIARGITFENYAGPSMGQAVAFRSGADHSAFYRCSFVGYQDTLYVHSLRQFYRECDVYGTIDFIFGNAAVVIQNSNIYARRPNDNQFNVLTAQGRDDPNQNTGISFINCKVAAASDLIPVVNRFKTFLGRPWRNYSRTVYMFSNIGRFVDPSGWLKWDGDFALETLYYGEYMNHGDGSDTSQRVTWPGYRVIQNVTEASQFTVANLLKGNEWLPATGVPFYPNLTEPC